MTTPSRWFLITVFIIALIGFADASYLTAEHVRGTIPPCTILNGCQTVLTSSYAVLFGMPLPVLGMLYYGTALVLLIAYFDMRDGRMLRIFSWLTAIGFLGSVYFVYLQVFVLAAYCLYCLVSAATSTLLFVSGIQIMRTK